MVLVYHSPSGDTEIFMDELEKLLSKLKCHQYPVIMLGDFNMDLLSLKNNKTLLFLQNCMSYGYLSIVRIPTRVTPTSATLIDNIFVSHQNIVRKFVEVLLFETSDHFATFTDVVTDKSKIKLEPNYRLNWRDESEKNIADLVLSLNCIQFFQAQVDSDSAYSAFIDLITSSYNYHCPVLKEPKRKHLSRKPWMTRGLLVSVNNRKTLYKQYLNDASEENFHQFKEYRNKLNQLKINAKEIYFQKSSKNANGNPRKTWQIINSVIDPNKSEKIHHIKELVSEKESIKSPEKISSLLDSFFVNVGQKIKKDKLSNAKSKRKLMTQVTPPKLKKQETMAEMQNFPSVTCDEVKKCICEIKGTRSTGLDGLSLQLIRKVQPAIIEALTVLINRSLDEGIFPNKLK